MTEPIFDHEQLDVCRLSIDYVAFSFRIARTLSGVNRQARDQWLRAAQSIPLNIAEGNGKQIHDVLRVCDAIDDQSNGRGKSDMKRIVSMLTRLIQRTEGVSEGSIEYEYESEDERTIPCIGAGLAAVIEGTINLPGPVTGGVG